MVEEEIETEHDDDDEEAVSEDEDEEERPLVNFPDPISGRDRFHYGPG